MCVDALLCSTDACTTCPACQCICWGAPQLCSMHAAGVLTETTAELAASLTFAAARRIVEGDRYMRKGQYMGWGPTLMVGQLLQVWQLLLCAEQSPLQYKMLDSPIVHTWLCQQVHCRRSVADSACCWQLAK